MQNDEYYSLFMKEWEKMLGEPSEVTEEEIIELKLELLKQDMHKVSKNESVPEV